MLKLAVIGAQTLLGRELVQSLEPLDCSVLPLSTGPLSAQEEEGDLVVFAPEPALLEGLDLIILADTPQIPNLVEEFPGRLLDLRAEPDGTLEPMPLVGVWPEAQRGFRGRPALEQVLALLPGLVEGVGGVAGTHLRSIACLGDAGLDGLLEQTVDVLNGHEPNLEKLGYRAAFEMVPQTPRGNLVEIRVPAFHGDLLVLHLRSGEGTTLEACSAPAGVRWVDQPPSSRDVATCSDLLACLSLGAARDSAVLILGYDPILWGVLRPVIRLLGLI